MCPLCSEPAPARARCVKIRRSYRGVLMANKRIELEQYKSYVDLIEEDPNRKTVRKGLTVVFVTALLLIVFLFVMGIFSNNLAKNPRNVLEKPPVKAPSMPPQPSGQQLPSGQQPVPTPSKLKVPLAFDRQAGVGIWDAGGPSVSLKEGTLYALQTQPVTQQPQQVTVPSSGTVTMPVQSGTQVPTTKEAKKKSKGPGGGTKGAGNLAKLTTGAGGRGFIIYVLVLSILLAFVFYLALRHAKRVS